MSFLITIFNTLLGFIQSLLLPLSTISYPIVKGLPLNKPMGNYYNQGGLFKNTIDFYVGFSEYLTPTASLYNIFRKMGAGIASFLYTIDKSLQFFYVKLFSLFQLSDNPYYKGTGVDTWLKWGQALGFAVFVVLFLGLMIGTFIFYENSGFKRMKGMLWNLALITFFISGLPFITNQFANGIQTFATAALGTNGDKGNSNNSIASISEDIFVRSVVSVPYKLSQMSPGDSFKIGSSEGLMYRQKPYFGQYQGVDAKQVVVNLDKMKDPNSWNGIEDVGVDTFLSNYGSDSVIMNKDNIENYSGRNTDSYQDIFKNFIDYIGADVAQMSEFPQFKSGFKSKIIPPILQSSYAYYSVNWFAIYSGLILLMFVLSTFIFKLIIAFYKALIMYSTSALVLLASAEDGQKVKTFIRHYWGLFEMLIIDVVVLRLFFVAYFTINSLTANIILDSDFPGLANTTTLALVRLIANIALFVGSLNGVNAINQALGQPSGSTTQGFMQTMLALQGAAMAASGAKSLIGKTGKAVSGAGGIAKKGGEKASMLSSKFREYRNRGNANKRKNTDGFGDLKISNFSDSNASSPLKFKMSDDFNLTKNITPMNAIIKGKVSVNKKFDANSFKNNKELKLLNDNKNNKLSNANESDSKANSTNDKSSAISSNSSSSALNSSNSTTSSNSNSNNVSATSSATSSNNSSGALSNSSSTTSDNSSSSNVVSTSSATSSNSSSGALSNSSSTTSDNNSSSSSNVVSTSSATSSNNSSGALSKSSSTSDNSSSAKFSSTNSATSSNSSFGALNNSSSTISNNSSSSNVSSTSSSKSSNNSSGALNNSGSTSSNSNSNNISPTSSAISSNNSSVALNSSSSITSVNSDSAQINSEAMNFDDSSSHPISSNARFESLSSNIDFSNYSNNVVESNKDSNIKDSFSSHSETDDLNNKEGTSNESNAYIDNLGSSQSDMIKEKPPIHDNKNEDLDVDFDSNENKSSNSDSITTKSDSITEHSSTDHSSHVSEEVSQSEDDLDQSFDHEQDSSASEIITTKSASNTGNSSAAHNSKVSEETNQPEDDLDESFDHDQESSASEIIITKSASNTDSSSTVHSSHVSEEKQKNNNSSNEKDSKVNESIKDNNKNGKNDESSDDIEPESTSHDELDLNNKFSFNFGNKKAKSKKSSWEKIKNRFNQMKNNLKDDDDEK